MTIDREVGSIFPTFSIILETENLTNADIRGLERSLNCLARQTPAPTNANEVFLIDSGDTPRELLKILCQKFDWLQVLTVRPGTTYYQAKMVGAEQATGEVIVYYDSDCLYNDNWLSLILQPFTLGNEIQIVAGETMTLGRGPYGTAMSLVYIFPQFTHETELTTTRHYFLNNVAFRRDLLLRHPIPTDLPLYRGNCVVHAHDLTHQGYTIWKQPLAKTLHAPPNGFSHFLWRFLLIGYDYYWQKEILRDRYTPARSARKAPSKRVKVPGAESKLGVFRDRVQKMLINNPRHMLYLPLALPITLVAALLIYVGYLMTQMNHKFLLTTYNQILGEA
ncbi:MAG TPA: glycosyltransferase family 2 protein [Leptolyngbyaceae cyanobacterium M33_DOE_097]|uniref:Glycosyltransferase family 2 protein n=1 Tax=Oscillatoriales cyanobacterium SpSt-418 TaxID=2282169 RepID=A0A7C3PIA4_9CYAN|nr:glycosyltransferase family 2 protein [Leptolyngbyaceae cyanobacterium M33_DOE_097]